MVSGAGWTLSKRAPVLRLSTALYIRLIVTVVVQWRYEARHVRFDGRRCYWSSRGALFQCETFSIWQSERHIFADTTMASMRAVCAVTEAYQDSANCRLELKFAAQVSNLNRTAVLLSAQICLSTCSIADRNSDCTRDDGKVAGLEGLWVAGYLDRGYAMDYA
jgi:hypothetical protein